MATVMDQVIADRTVVAEEERPGLPFAFTGDAKEYFGIWIVNILLSIVTLGIYSAWAKVRNKRYFYGNTLLDNSSFDYLASPVQILKGRLIAFAVLAAVSLLTYLSPAWLLLYLLLYLFVPLIIQRAIRFNAQNSSYRNVRFGFVGSVGDAYTIYLFLPILGIFTFGLLTPYLAFTSKRYLITGSRYGKTKFKFHGKLRRYYVYFGLAFLMGILAYGLAIAALFSTFAIQDGMATAPFSEETATAASLIPAALLAGFFFLVIYSYLTVRLQNYAFNNTRIDDHQLRLSLQLWPFLWIRVTNVLAIVLTVGLMIPWAKIRMARYQIERMSLIPHGDFDTLVDEEQKRTRALGEELGEGMDLDLGIGV